LIECLTRYHFVSEMLAHSRSLTRLSSLGRCRQLTARAEGSRGLRVVTGDDARSISSLIDHSEATATTTRTNDGSKQYLTPSKVYDAAGNTIDTTFENAKEVYTSKTNFELLRGYIVFQLCSLKLFVNNNKQVHTRSME